MGGTQGPRKKRGSGFCIPKNSLINKIHEIFMKESSFGDQYMEGGPGGRINE